MINRQEREDIFDPYKYLRGELAKRGVAGPAADSYCDQFQRTVNEDLEEMARTVAGVAKRGKFVETSKLFENTNFSFPGNAKQRADEIIQRIDSSRPKLR